MCVRAVLIGVAMALASPAHSQPADPPLVLEAKISLGEVNGRIDHLSVDLKRKQLFVAELGNDSLGIVDIGARKVLHRIAGLSEPQGVGYEPSTDSIFVANAGDGSVRIYRGEGFSPIGRIDLGDDADNIRVDAVRNRVVVGYGKGALAVIDPARRAKIADIRLQGHPEGFQIDNSGTLAFVNVPDARRIEAVDLINGTAQRDLPTQNYRSNFPMAIDRETDRVLVVFRNPARLLVLSAKDGAVVASPETCGDADDVFVDAKRRRVYVTCGSGTVDAFAEQAGTYQPIGHVATASGARTSLLVPELDRLFVAVRATGSEAAAVWVFRPAP